MRLWFIALTAKTVPLEEYPSYGICMKASVQLLASPPGVVQAKALSLVNVSIYMTLHLQAKHFMSWVSSQLCNGPSSAGLDDKRMCRFHLRCLEWGRES